ncbi:hypothetical protein HETIRDRAFT_315019 [Heterobasidion irregulare TC 32-1]|uniref:Uncharacterized protein n=1 Tax=Heterobasidion irregulare (strain TC 32-1) TaxID=747525 RepID=W4KAI7_HETIT|nr:uncharacterized protein HETIRDRAFT_315019 [Heterobasidion irregulare TC 32-1]ETW82370.1 hypothetical protein HETIRDRAFT_315019 [Heterobasidion irregulare TC 32-1]
MQRAALPRFPLKLGHETFDRVCNYIQKDLKYEGPLGPSCDDTKLLSTLRTYWDALAKTYYLVGHTGKPIVVANPEELEALLKSEMLEKATKVCVWCVQIPMPKASSIVTHVLAIPNSCDAEELQAYSDKIICGLVQRGLKVISYTCDGTETERKVQCCLIRDSPFHITYTIQHPNPAVDFEDMTVIIATREAQPIVMIQDSKHALKTMRNNNFSGAKLLVLGNTTAKYSDVRDAAFGPGISPLYPRDVENLDCQDDNAATRLFSASSLEYLATHFPDHVGEIVHLFIFGELVDAYQNRKISHLSRIKMVLRTHYFLDIWAQFLDRAGYVKSKHFISHEATDIVQIIIEGLIGLVIIH